MNSTAEMRSRLCSSFSFSRSMRVAGFLAISRQDAAGAEMAARRGSRDLRLLKPPLHGSQVGAHFFELAARWSGARAGLFKPSTDSRIAMEMTRTRYRRAAVAAGLRNACGVGPPTVCATVPPPDRPSVGDDYVAILTGLAAGFRGVLQNKTGKYPHSGSPTCPSHQSRRASCEADAFRAFLGA